MVSTDRSAIDAREQQTDPRTFLAAAGRGLASGNDAIIIADDDEAVRTMLTNDILLCDPEIQVFGCNDGTEALQALKHIREAYGRDPALVILDLDMPGVDGWDVLEELEHTQTGRSVTERIPVIVLSGHSGDKRRFAKQRRSVHGAKAYHPMITIAKRTNLHRHRYQAVGHESLLAWLHVFVAPHGGVPQQEGTAHHGTGSNTEE